MKLQDIKTEIEFNAFNKKDVEKVFNETSSSEWKIMGEKNAIDIYRSATTSVPGYKQFIESNIPKVLPVVDASDFKNVPVTDKKNYIDKYSFEDLVWNGDLSECNIINSSSGTTGVPYFWPSSEYQVIQGALIKEYIYRNSFDITNNKTLLIICFGMGTWIAGSFTLATSQMVAKKGYPLTIITPGFNKQETLRILKMVSPKYEQTIIAGIPTFVKDLLDEWKQYDEAKTVKKMKFLFAAEAFSEAWRDYILSMVGSTATLTDVVGVLGSADAALMGFETPMSILVRKLVTENKELRYVLFNDERVPSLQNYVPTHRYFEVVEDELVITSKSSIPLLRYNIHDKGGLITSDHTQKVLKEFGYDISVEFKLRGLEYIPNNLPFVYLFGRGKFVATIYAANIYPENVRDVLVHEHVREHTTGQFTIETVFDDNQDHYLHLNVELAANVEEKVDLEDKIAEVFVKVVSELNGEYNRINQEYGVKAKPKIKLHKYGHSELFPKDRIKKNS